MALTKVNYIDNETVITAANMNAIQDEVIKNSEAIENGIAAPTLRATYDEETQTMKFENVPKEVEDQLYAPSGYGWGEGKPHVSIDANTANKTCVFVSAINTPTTEHTWLCEFYATSDDGNGNWGHMIATCQDEGMEGCVCTRLKRNGVWTPWDWNNPPMLLGVEYRTTERHLGKAVYVKYFDAGKIVNNTWYNPPSGTTQIIRFEGSIDNNVALPAGKYTIQDPTGGYYAYITASVNGKAIYLYCDSKSDGFAAGDAHLYLKLWYTKD